MSNAMAYFKSSIFVVAIIFISTEIASSFPAEHERESRPADAVDYDRTERVGHEQSFNWDLYSILPCEGARFPENEKWAERIKVYSIICLLHAESLFSPLTASCSNIQLQ